MKEMFVILLYYLFAHVESRGEESFNKYLLNLTIGQQRDYIPPAPFPPPYTHSKFVSSLRSYSSFPEASPTVIKTHYYKGDGVSGLFGSDYKSFFYKPKGHYDREYGQGLGTYGFSDRWGYRDERNWRLTTKAPYFHNKVPGSEMPLPAAAVLGAATAFGVYSLLPLFVYAPNPILSCNSTMINQIDVMYNDNIFTCVQGSIALSCPLTEEEKLQISRVKNSKLDEPFSDIEEANCEVKPLDCKNLVYTHPNLLCTNNTIVSIFDMLCESTFIRNHIGRFRIDKKPVLRCRQYTMYPPRIVLVPTRGPETTTRALESTTEKGTFEKAKDSAYEILMWTIGRSDLIKKEKTTKAPFTGSLAEYWEVPYLLTNSSDLYE